MPPIETIEGLKSLIQREKAILANLNNESELLMSLDRLADTSPVFAPAEATLLSGMIISRLVDNAGVEFNALQRLTLYETRLTELEASE